MSANPYEESLLDLIKKNSKALTKIAISLVVIIGIMFAIFWYTKPNKNEESQIDGKNIVRSYNYSEGKKDSSIKIIEYYDYECHVCQGFEPTMKDFVKSHGDKVEVVYKHLPVIGINSRSAAEASQAAGEQGKFIEYKTAVFALFKDSKATVLNSDTLTQIAKNLNLDVDKWNQRRNSKEIKDQVEQDIKDIQNAKLPPSSRDGSTKGGNSTPGFVVIKNNEILDWWAGGLSLEEMKGKVDKILQS
jgi:thiol-disulfide isomerase/thioredoxin